MIQFEIDSSGQGIEVFLNAKGIDELIIYLNFIKDKQEHMHLVIGNELSEEMPTDGNTQVRHVVLRYRE